MSTSASPALKIQENVPLAPYTTFRIGGPARYFCKVTSEAELLEAVHFGLERGFPIFALGGGSNLLIADQGFNGLVLQIAIDNAIHIDGVYKDGEPTATPLLYRVPAGLEWDEFVLRTVEAGLSGIECLAGIPGLVGGSPIQNIGAYGQEVADTIHSVRALDRESLTFVELSKADCRFAYRSSIFNSTYRNRYIVVEVTFRFDLDAVPNLTYADLQTYFAGSAKPPKPIEVYHAVRGIRDRKGMLIVEGEQDCRSAGSFFKNPVVPSAALEPIAAALDLDSAAVPHWPAGEGKVKLPAAWLLERAGFHKGYRLGRAGISSRHTLALINRGQASASDIAALRDRIVLEVSERFHVRLEQEPVQLG